VEIRSSLTPFATLNRSRRFLDERPRLAQAYPFARILSGRRIGIPWPRMDLGVIKSTALISDRTILVAGYPFSLGVLRKSPRGIRDSTRGPRS
jgi:hypothetical protein